MAKKKKNKKVIRYRRPLNINVGMIIFALIFAYMAFYVYTYVRREKIEFYEVPEGSIVNDQRHTGIERQFLSAGGKKGRSGHQGLFGG